MKKVAALLCLPLLACGGGELPAKPLPGAAPPVPAATGVPSPAIAPDEPRSIFLDPDRRRKLAAAFPEIDAVVAEVIARTKLPGAAVGVVIDGELAYAKGFGVTDQAKKTPIDADTVFGLASITKPFTALTVLALRDDGQLSLDDPLVKWVPEASLIVYPTRDSPPITIRHLLDHTAGLPGDGVHPLHFGSSAPSEQELLASLSGLPLERAPGTRFRYSNLGYELLGVVIARAGHGPLRDVAKRRILDPLGMTSTGWDAGAVAPGKLAVAHQIAGGVATPITPMAFGAVESAGGLLSSLRDMARFAAFQLAAYPPSDAPVTGPVARSTVREAHFTTVDANAWFPDRAVGLHVDFSIAPKKGEPTLTVISDRYGYGWGAVRTCDLDDIVWHAGGGPPGYSTMVELLHDRGVGVIALANGFGGGAFVPVAKIVAALVRTGGLSKRVPQPEPRYDVALRRFLSVYNSWNEVEYLAMADRVAADAPAEKEELAGYKALHGACKSYAPLEPATPAGFRFALQCERGRLTMLVSLAGDGRISAFAGTSRDVEPPPHLREIGDRVVGLIAKWDDAWARKHLAKAKSQGDALRDFEDLRWSHASCSARGALRDWTGWKLDVDCERGGPLVLALSLDADHPDVVTSYSFASRGDGGCPTR